MLSLCSCPSNRLALKIGPDYVVSLIVSFQPPGVTRYAWRRIAVIAVTFTVPISWLIRSSRTANLCPGAGFNGRANNICFKTCPNYQILTWIVTDLRKGAQNLRA